MKLSYSAIQKYLECPLRFKLHYKDFIREKVWGSALVFGEAIDEALNALHSDKKDTFKDVYYASITKHKINGIEEDLATSKNIRFSNGDFDPDIIDENDTKNILDYFTSIGFTDLPPDLTNIHEQLKHIKRNRAFNDDERQLFQYMSWYSLKKKGALMLDAYVEQVLPRIKRVISVQKYFEVTNTAGESLIGYIDMICEWEDGRIIRFDHKASSEKYTEQTIKEKLQLSTYTFGTEEEWPAKDVGYIVMPKKFRKKKLPLIPIQVIIGKITPEQESNMIDIYDQVAYDISQEKFDCKYGSCDKTDDPFGCPYKKYNQNGSLEGLVRLGKKV